MVGTLATNLESGVSWNSPGWPEISAIARAGSSAASGPGKQRNLARAHGERVDARAFEQLLDPDQPHEILRFGAVARRSGRAAPASSAVSSPRRPRRKSGDTARAAGGRRERILVREVRGERRFDLRLAPAILWRLRLSLELADRFFKQLCVKIEAHGGDVARIAGARADRRRRGFRDRARRR